MKAIGIEIEKALLVECRFDPNTIPVPCEKEPARIHRLRKDRIRKSCDQQYLKNVQNALRREQAAKLKTNDAKKQRRFENASCQGL